MGNSTCVNRWLDFRIGDLFEISRPVARSDKMYDLGAMPYVASGNVNNGVMSYLQPKSDDDYDMGNCITVSPVDGCAFYQKDNFLGRGGAGSSIIILRSDMLTELTGLFLSTVIRVVCSDWSYSNMGNKDILADMKIKLLATPAGEPDWDYMEQYMKTVMDRQAHVIDSLTRISKEKHPVDVSAWGEFRVGDLFECTTTLSIPSKNNLLDGSLNYVTRSAENNGLSGTCGNDICLNKGQCITIGAEGFVAFWQDDDFVAGNKVYAIRHDNMTELSGLFVCAALNTLSGRYSFSDARVLDRIKCEIIRLPVTCSGEPDWGYMADYMRFVLDRQEHVVRCLKEMQDCNNMKGV